MKRPAITIAGQWFFGVGLACAAFSRLFGGDVSCICHHISSILCCNVCPAGVCISVISTVLSSLLRRLLSPGLLVAWQVLFNLSPDPTIAIAASVLLLVPGVPLINAGEDFTTRAYAHRGIARRQWRADCDVDCPRADFCPSGLRGYQYDGTSHDDSLRCFLVGSGGNGICHAIQCAATGINSLYDWWRNRTCTAYAINAKIRI